MDLIFYSLQPTDSNVGVMEVEEGIDTFTLLHHDVCVSTNSVSTADIEVNMVNIL